MSPKTIEATGEENESKYRSGRGTGLIRSMVFEGLSKKKKKLFERNCIL